MTKVVNPRFVDEKGTLTNQGQADVAHGLAVLRHAVAINNFEKGWRAPDSEPREIGTLIALLHSEVTEAFESYRNGERPLWYEYPNGVTSDSNWRLPCDEVLIGDSRPDEFVLGKPQGIASELADVLIRLLDMADEHSIPLVEAVLQKHAFNQTRAHRHGGKVV